MEAVARGSCPSCKTPQVYMVWKNGKRVLVIECDCGERNIFDVEGLEQALGSNDPVMQMLESFEPKGLPS